MPADKVAIIRYFEVHDGQAFCIQNLNEKHEPINEVCMERDGAIQMAISILNLFVYPENDEGCFYGQEED